MDAYAMQGMLSRHVPESFANCRLFPPILPGNSFYYLSQHNALHTVMVFMGLALLITGPCGFVFARYNSLWIIVLAVWRRNVSR